MWNPRAIGVGPTITGANVKPGGNDNRLIGQSAPAAQAQIHRAARIDREADLP
jgi:hypothetical protein